MAGTITAKGTANGKAVTDRTVTGVTIAAGSSILVAICYDSVSGSIDALSWGSESFAEVPGGAATSGLGSVTLYAAHNVAGGTHDLQVVFTDPVAASVAVMEMSGCVAAPDDRQARASGVSTSPSSGATATTSQADEVIVGIVGTNGPSGDTAGTWGGSFTSDQRDGTTGGVANTNFTVSTGYRVVAAAAGYTAAKTGITSRGWGAICATFKVAASDVAVSLGVPSAASAAPTVTPAAGGVSVGLGLPSSAGAAPGAASSGADGLTLGVPTAAMSLDTFDYLDVLGNEAQAAQVAEADAGDPVTVYTPVDLSKALNHGIRSLGQAYFAMWMQNLAGFGTTDPGGGSLPGGECTAALVFSLHAAPPARESVDEPHWLLSVHEVATRRELFSIGVTPDQRLCCKSYSSPIVYSAPGIVPANGQPMSVRMDGPGGGGFAATIDGIRVLSVSYSPGEIAGLYSPTGIQTRVMLFNGGEGLSKIDATIHAAGFYSENFNFIWPLTEGKGPEAHGFEATTDVDDIVVPAPTPDYPDADFTCTAGWFDPAPFPQAWDAVPGGSVSGAYRWLRRATYRPVSVARPAYTEFGGNSPAYQPAEEP